MALILSGKETSAAIDKDSLARAEELKKNGIIPTLAVVRVGHNDADLSYERGLKKKAEKTSVRVMTYVIEEENESANTEKLTDTIRELNEDDSIHGILLFRPLPKYMDEYSIINMIDPVKDVDGVTDSSLSYVFSGKGKGFAPCTPEACIEILDHYGIELKGKNSVVIGRSLVVGKPLSMLLLGRHSTVTVCHTRTIDLAGTASKADILFAAAGKAGIVDSDFVSDDQIVIDVGINFTEEGKLTGDVDFESVEPVVKAITPVPGGVGSVTSSVLMKHVISACEAGRG